MQRKEKKRKVDKWKVATIFFGILMIIQLVFISSNQRVEETEAYGVTVSRDLINQAQEKYGNEDFQICDIDAGKCIVFSPINSYKYYGPVPEGINETHYHLTGEMIPLE